MLLHGLNKGQGVRLEECERLGGGCGLSALLHLLAAGTASRPQAEEARRGSGAKSQQASTQQVLQEEVKEVWAQGP